jgi:hypothetical protein
MKDMVVPGSKNLAVSGESWLQLVRKVRIHTEIPSQ